MFLVPIAQIIMVGIFVIVIQTCIDRRIVIIVDIVIVKMVIRILHGKNNAKHVLMDMTLKKKIDIETFRLN